MNREIVQLAEQRKSYQIDTLEEFKKITLCITEIRDSFFKMNDIILEARKKLDFEYFLMTVAELCKFYRTLCIDELVPYAQTLENILKHEYGAEKYTAQEGEIFDYVQHEKLDRDNTGSIINSTIYEGWRIGKAIVIPAVVTVKEEEDSYV